MYRVVFYCPDKHIEYDGNTPYRTGVGGGITARVRMAKALSKAGHEVVMVVNCPRRERIDSVDYVPLGEINKIRSEVLIMNTSGGAYDLSPILSTSFSAKLKIVWMSGTAVPEGLDEVDYDLVYAKSNFLRSVAISEWGVQASKIFVAYNGFDEDLFIEACQHQVIRDPFRLAFFSHPSKGLDHAILVLDRLRRLDSRYHLVVFGGPRLWGQPEIDLPEAEGLIYKGLVGQLELARELMQCSYSICLQSREEPFGMVVTESMRAGCVVFASPVGAYVELIQDGEDGFLIEGNPRTRDVQNQVVALIVELSHNPEAVSDLRRNAQAVIWDCDTMARVWLGHWDWWFSGKNSEAVSDGVYDSQSCSNCGGRRLLLEDGYHCVSCGRYAWDHGAYS